MTKTELYWLAGILEGEGSFMKGPPSKPNQPLISLEMMDRETVSKVANIFGTKCMENKRRKSKRNTSYVCRLNGVKSLDLMEQLKPLMSRRRQHQISVAVLSYDPNKRKVLTENRSKIKSIDLSSAKERMLSGESLRSVARYLCVNHETLRRRLLAA